VGSRHVYDIGQDPNLPVMERKEIEQTYADGVAADQAAYQTRVDLGGSAAQQAKFRDADIEELAAERDQRLGSLFQLRDDLRATHPELRAIDVDGPYQVIGIDYELQNGDTPVFDDMVVYAPWPDYSYIGTPFGGWVYGTVYPASFFSSTYLTWRSGFHDRWFYRGIVGHHGRIFFENGRVVGKVTDFGALSAYSRAVAPGQTAAKGSVPLPNVHPGARTGAIGRSPYLGQRPGLSRQHSGSTARRPPFTGRAPLRGSAPAQSQRAWSPPPQRGTPAGPRRHRNG
jgi:hypothetical protein